jgi:hypothetical protein
MIKFFQELFQLSTILFVGGYRFVKFSSCNTLLYAKVILESKKNYTFTYKWYTICTCLHQPKGDINKEKKKFLYLG